MRATGAVVLTLLAHRRDWVRHHVETIDLIDRTRARRRVEVDFELPEGGRAAGPPGTLTLAPLALVHPRPEAVDVRDEQGRPVPVLPARWTADIVAAGVLGLASTATADPRLADVVRRLAGEERLLLVGLEDASRRRVLTYSYDETLTPPRSRLRRLLTAPWHVYER